MVLVHFTDQALDLPGGDGDGEAVSPRPRRARQHQRGPHQVVAAQVEFESKI